MPILLTVVDETLLYLLSIPLNAAFTLNTAGGVRWGVGFSAFGAGAALRRARLCRPVKKRRGRGGAKYAGRLLRGARIRVRGRLGLGDAAATALVCGALRAAGGGRVTVDVAPVFSEAAPCLELQGMIRLRTGQIMTAIASTQIENIRRRIARWTDIRSKA